jgi:hypothetical protein
MNQRYNWAWIESQAAETTDLWNNSAGTRLLDAKHYTVAEQQHRERAYDKALQTVERELKRARKFPGTAGRRATQERITAAFAQFSAAALDLGDDAIHLLTDDFLPSGTKLARWARHFDPTLSMPDIIQACRNAWTACGLQPLLGERVELTPSILGYSLLYPYSDNYLDGENISTESKLRFSHRFRQRLEGEPLAPANDRETAIWALVDLVESQYPRPTYPGVFDCLLAIHQAQEHSIAQVRSHDSEAELLRLSCAKGGSSVLADGCLARGWLTAEESRFSFEWGVLLQLGDDLQDVPEDLQRGSVTLFSGPASRRQRLDGRVIQLLTLSERVSDHMDQMPHGTAALKSLLRMSWRSLILMAVAASHEYFSPEFLHQAQQISPFRFDFLRARRDKLAGRRGLYATLFNAFVDPNNSDDDAAPPLPAAKAALAPSAAD